MSLWWEATRVFQRNELYASPELEQLERKIINSGSCGVARQGYTRLTAYNAVSSKPLLDQVTTLIEAADSDFFCAEDEFSGLSPKTRSALRRGALSTYQKAYELLDRRNVAPDTIDGIFSPEVPVMLAPLPAHPMPPAASPSAAAGHIDVAFEITAEGRARKVRILDATTNTADDVKKGLVAWIEASLYRPRVGNGRIGDSPRIVWRYYW